MRADASGWRYGQRVKMRALLLVALLTAASLAGPSAVRGAEADIPGTPLEGRSVAGAVGAAVVDEVYAISLPASVILTATLSGESGAELGLYLFAPGADSILTAAPLTQSAKPGGAQSVSWVTDQAGVYYLNVNGRNLNRRYGYTLTALTRQDTTPPLIDRADAALVSRSERTCVYVRASDSVSGVESIRISADPEFNGSEWESYNGADWYCTSLNVSEGLHDVYVQVKNGVRAVSAVRRVQVLIDNSAPTLVSTFPAPEGDLLEPRGEVSWRFDEPVRLLAPASETIFVVNQMGTRIAGSLRLSANQRRVIWTPTLSVPAGTTLLLNLRSVSDAAGNQAASLDSLVIQRRRAVSMRLSLLKRGPAALRFAYKTPAGLAGRSVSVEMRVGGRWAELKSIELVSSVDLLRLTRAELGDADRVRLSWLGDETFAPATTPGVRLAP